MRVARVSIVGQCVTDPYVVVVEEADRTQLDVFVARIEAKYGLYLSETCKGRVQ